MATALLALEDNGIDPRLARSFWFPGGTLMTMHAEASETEGAFALVEVSANAGSEPPLHVHTSEDELFYVLEGRLKVTRGSEQLIVEAGESGFLPRSIPHTFKITSGFARWLVYITPGKFEEFFRALSRPAEYLRPEENPAPPDLRKMIRVANQFGIAFC